MTSPEDAALIVESLSLAGERGGDLTRTVYAKLFEQQPEMQALFVMDKTHAVKGEMLSRVFDAILDFVGERRYAHNLIKSEIVTHDGYNVPPDVFATFFVVVKDTVADACGPHWTIAMDEAWRRLLTDLDRYMAQATLA